MTKPRFEIDREDMGGWVRVFLGRGEPTGEVARFLSHSLTDWIRERPHLRLRFAVPINRDGDTVELHAWYDQVLFPDTTRMAEQGVGGKGMNIAANLFADIPTNLPDELSTTLLTATNVRIERIISHGHASAPDFWYDQPQHEWVIVLKGAARLQFEDGMVELKVGDFVSVPAFKKHRVDWTTPHEPTVWLGVRYG